MRAASALPSAGNPQALRNTVAATGSIPADRLAPDAVISFIGSFSTAC